MLGWILNFNWMSWNILLTKCKHIKSTHTMIIISPTKLSENEYQKFISLVQGRVHHWCARFVNTNGPLVRLIPSQLIETVYWDLWILLAHSSQVTCHMKTIRKRMSYMLDGRNSTKLIDIVFIKSICQHLADIEHIFQDDFWHFFFSLLSSDMNFISNEDVCEWRQLSSIFIDQLKLRGKPNAQVIYELQS